LCVRPIVYPFVIATPITLKERVARSRAGDLALQLQNLSIKLDPAQIHALRKIATMKAIPYQTLIRQWLAEGIRRELRLGHS
jgi:predicted DNA binding CopG/RHH family protein